MQSYSPRTRLYVDVPLPRSGEPVALPAKAAHYLRAVLRAEVGQDIEVFNGHDGAFAAGLTALSKSGAQVVIGERVAAQETLPKLSLAFAALKKDRTQMVVEKATELGAARIIPMVTTRTQGQAVKQLKAEKLRAYAIEACEQCGRTALPDVASPMALAEVLAQEGLMLFADEMRAGGAHPWPEPQGWTTILIGPEGGWSAEERSLLEDTPNAHPISLGPRILRAETAAIAALTMWQSRFGDWS